MARINDLERGFQQTLAYAYGKHVVQGHLIMHNIDIIGTDKQVTMLMALGDGAYNEQGEGAWGISAQMTGPTTTADDGYVYFCDYFGNAGGPIMSRVPLDSYSIGDIESFPILLPSADMDSNNGSMTQDENYIYLCTTNPTYVHRISKASWGTYDYALIGTTSTDETIGFGASIGQTAIAVDGTYIYVGFNKGSLASSTIRLHRLLKSDFTTQNILTVMSPGGGAFNITLDASFIYLVDHGSVGSSTNDKAIKVSKSSFTVSATVDLGARGIVASYNGAITSDSSTLFVNGNTTTGIMTIDKSTFASKTNHAVGQDLGPIMLDDDGTKLWCGVYGGTPRVKVFDKTTFAELEAINLADSSIAVIKLSQDADYVYALQGETSPTRKITRISKTDFTITTLSIPGDYVYSMVADSVPGTPESTGSPFEADGDAVDAVYYAGRLISPENWHYHPGTFSTGKDDPIQGIDSFFPDGITYSATAYIAIRLPLGVADDADPSKVAVILNTSCIADYDSDGNITEIGYSSNPARVKADMLKRRGQHTRINWDSYIQARDWYDELIPWEAGDAVNTYTDVTQAPTYSLSGNIQVGGGGALSKVTAVTANDNGAVTQERIAGGQEGYLKAVLGGSFPTGTSGGAMYLIDSSNKAWFGIAWGNGHYSILANNVPIDDITEPYDFPAVAGDEIKLEISGGEFVLKQNGIIKTPPQGTSLVPLETDLFGKIVLLEGTASVTSSEIQGQVVVSSELNTSQIKRFEAHPAFTSAVDLPTALDFTDSLCASDTIDAGAEIIFTTPATPNPRKSLTPFTFTESDNVVSGTLRVYRRDIRERPNRLSGQFRDLTTVYMESNEVFVTRDELYDQLGYIIDPGALNFASMNPSQGMRLLQWNMRRMSDNDLFCELRGMDDSLEVLVGDIVVVSSPKLPDGADTDFIVLSATRDSGESGAYERSFVLQEWHADDYRDTDHDVTQGTIVTPPTSTFDPPSAPVLMLDQSTAIAGDVITNKILGTVYFALYAGTQTAKIYVTVPGGSEVDSGIIVTPTSGMTSGTFEYIASTLGEYTFRAEAISGTTGVPGGSDTKSITILDVIIDDATGDPIVDDDTSELLTEG